MKNIFSFTMALIVIFICSCPAFAGQYLCENYPKAQVAEEFTTFIKG